MGNLAVTNKAAVDPQINAGIDALKIQIIPAVGISNPELGPVDAAGIIQRDMRRVIGEGVADVGVLVVVIPVHLPDRGNGYRIELIAGFVFVMDRDFTDGIKIFEFPVAIEQNEAGRGFAEAVHCFARIIAGDVISAGRFRPDVQDMVIFIEVVVDHVIRPFLNVSARERQSKSHSRQRQSISLSILPYLAQNASAFCTINRKIKLQFTALTRPFKTYYLY